MFKLGYVKCWYSLRMGIFLKTSGHVLTWLNSEYCVPWLEIDFWHSQTYLKLYNMSDHSILYHIVGNQMLYLLCHMQQSRCVYTVMDISQACLRLMINSFEEWMFNFIQLWNPQMLDLVSLGVELNCWSCLCFANLIYILQIGTILVYASNCMLAPSNCTIYF